MTVMTESPDNLRAENAWTDVDYDDYMYAVHFIGKYYDPARNVYIVERAWAPSTDILTGE